MEKTALAWLFCYAKPFHIWNTFFVILGKELPETYNYLEKIEARLGISIKRLSAARDFDFWLQRGGGFLPSPRQRWCTLDLKIIPLEKFVGDDEVYSYIGIREDEDRVGYVSTKQNIKPVYPYKSINFKIHGKSKNLSYDQQQLVEDLKTNGIDLPVKKRGYNLDYDSFYDPN